MHNRQPLTLKMIWKSTMDYHLWPLYLIGLLFGLPATPITNYLQLSFKSLGFNTIQANLLSIPYTVISVINCVVIAIVSELVDNRSFICMAEDLVSGRTFPLFTLRPADRSGSSRASSPSRASQRSPVGSTSPSHQ